MRVGASQVEITPELPFLLAGSGKIRVSDRVLDRLMASCTVIENDKTTVAFVSCDLLNVKKEFADAVREQICGKTGIDKDNIFISATHTHQGPKTGKNIPCYWIAPDKNMLEHLSRGIVEAAVKANNNKRPARLGYNKGSADNCGFNRRYIMANGRSQYAFRGFNPDRLVPEGPVDKEVQVVWFEDMEGNYISILVNFTCHPTVLFYTEMVSADFPGEMRSVVQTILGEDIPVLYLQGACGNINTVDIEDERTKCEGMEGLLRIGRVLGGEVVKLVSENNVCLKDDIEVAVGTRILDIPLRNITRDEYEAARIKWDQFSEDDKKNAAKFKEIFHTLSTVEIYEQMIVNPNCPVEISAVRIDDIIFATNPCELFVEYQLELKERFRGKKLMVVELTNGHAGYIPTKIAFALGGYEMERSASSKLDKEAGRIIVENTIEIIETLI